MMTKKDVFDIEQEQYNAMSRRKLLEQTKLEEYFRGFDDGLSKMSKVICERLELEEREEKKCPKN